LNVKRKEVRHQFFDSTEDRFKGSIFNASEALKSMPAEVGPGAYEAKDVFGSHDKIRHESPK
jgi:hypothetical protein